MKITIIKGPMFEQRREQAYELLYKLIREEVQKQQGGKQHESKTA